MIAQLRSDVDQCTEKLDDATESEAGATLSVGCCADLFPIRSSFSAAKSQLDEVRKLNAQLEQKTHELKASVMSLQQQLESVRLLRNRFRLACAYTHLALLQIDFLGF